jgi:predicted MFS family arabinose efflux permease
VVPLMWVFINAAGYVILINLVSGLLWGAYNLASFNYLLMITPPDRRARFSALFQIIVTVSLGIGAALGSLVITHWGFHAVVIGSAAGRLAAALLFVLLLTRKTGVGKVAEVGN